MSDDEQPDRLITHMADPRTPEPTGWMLLPAPPGVCSQCGVDHEPDQPHNQQKLLYQYWFYAEHSRWPTWEDAMAHCSDEVYEMWREGLAGHGVEVVPRLAAGDTEL